MLKTYIKKLPMQIGDVYKTKGKSKYLKIYKGDKKFTSLKDGINNFVNWYKDYYKKKI